MPATNTSPFTVEQLLNYATSRGIIDFSSLAEQMTIEMNAKYLQHHTFSIWFDQKQNCWLTWIPDEARPDGRRRIRRKTEQDLKDYLIEFYKAREKVTTVEDVIREWINHKSGTVKDISPATKLRYEKDLNRYFKGIGGTDIRKLTELTLVKHIEQTIGEQHLKHSAYSNMKIILRGAFKYAKREGLIDFRIDDVLDSVNVSEAAFDKSIKEDWEEVFDDFEYNQLISYLTDHLDKKNMVLLLIAITGCRGGEVAVAKASDFDDISYHVRRSETRFTDSHGKYHYEVQDHPKTAAGVRNVIIPESYRWILEEIRKYPANKDGYIFTDKFNKPYSTNVLNNRLRSICKKLDIYQKSPHKLRKTWFSIMLDNNIDNNLITTIGGHSNIVTTERHYHRNRKSTERMSEIISSVPEFQCQKRGKAIT